MHKSLILLALLAVAVPCSGNDRLVNAANKFTEAGEIHLGLFNKGERDGFMRLGWQRDDSILRIYDRSMMPSVEVYEAYAGAMDAETLAPRSVDIQFYQGTTVMEISINMVEGRASGTQKMIRPGADAQSKEVAVELPSGTVLRAFTFILPLVLDAKPGDNLSFPWYASMTNTITQVTLTVKDGGSVDTPAGRFDTLVYEIRGGAPENDVYVSTGENPNIIRIDVIGQPLQFLALEKQ